MQSSESHCSGRRPRSLFRFQCNGTVEGTVEGLAWEGPLNDLFSYSQLAFCYCILWGVLSIYCFTVYWGGGSRFFGTIILYRLLGVLITTPS